MFEHRVVKNKETTKHKHVLTCHWFTNSCWVFGGGFREACVMLHNMFRLLFVQSS